MSPVKGTRFKLMNDSCDHMGTEAVERWKRTRETGDTSSKLSCVLIVQEEQKVQDFFL